MSDTLSQVSSVSKAINRNAEKICAYCGKKERGDWARHFKNQHNLKLKEERLEWDRVVQPLLLGDPYCSNWKEVALNNVKPINVVATQQKGTTIAATVKRVANSVAVKSLPALSQFGDDVQMNDIIEEEKVQIETAQNSNFIAPRSILGKRSPPKPQGNLSYEYVVRQESQPSAKFSAKRLEGLVTVPVTQKVAPSQEFEFAMPDPLPQTIYRDQGMRDQEAIQQLKALEVKKTGSMTAQAMQLIKIAPYFAQPLVSSFIELSKEHLTHLKDLLLFAQTKAQELYNEEIIAIAFASMLFGGSCWDSLPKMLSSLDEGKLKEVLWSLCPYLATKFGDNLAKWVCRSWKYLDQQTLLLLRYLKEQNLENSLSSNIATLSTIVKVADLQEYCVLVEVFSKYSAYKIVLDSVSTSAPTWKSYQKLEFAYFDSLIDFLSTSENKQLIKAKEEELTELPLSQWLERLTKAKADSQIYDVSSVQYRLNQLQELHGQLSKNYATDLCHSGDPRFKRLLHNVTNRPNELQFANAQYAALSLKTYPKQLWCILSGQGKSRTLAIIASILLLTESTTKVHLVFDSHHLMQRDQNEFDRWFAFNNLADKIEFHVGMDFICQQGEIILVDEADELILSNPARFMKKIQQHKCICLTATPDNNDSQGVEREVLKLIGFSIFNGQPTNAATSTQELKPNETLTFGPCSDELVSFIQNEIKEHAVLLYCSEEFERLLIEKEISFTSIKDGVNINDEFLRTLDQRNQDETHALLVASSSFGMRGLDYRSPQKGVTLVLATSFQNQRQAIQGLCRVGRFGDKCKRYIAKGVSLIDQKEELKYLTSLNQFLNLNQRTKVVAHLPKEEKKKSNITTTTTGIQSAKSGKQNQLSQSALTTASFGTKNLSQKQARLLDELPKSKRRKRNKKK